ncbi:MAG: glutamine--fructose-6-phosphate transaminase (isomerizing) [Oligoflexales bacterium]
MCGIFGYVGNANCVEKVFGGLKKLEYRGYDSAGIAVLSEKKIHVIKEAGKLNNLEPHLNTLPNGTKIGMGHTRWATHGVPNQTNAHPHVVEPVAIVHNGIIENYAELKAELLAAGIKPKSDTDSEIVAHLISIALAKDIPTGDALASVMRKLEGSFALGVLVERDAGHIFLAKKGMPLVIGVGENEVYFSSDVNTFYPQKVQAIFLTDDQCARIGVNDIKVWNNQGVEQPYSKVKINWEVSSNPDKQGFKHFMLKEIFEQPQVIAQTTQRLINFDAGSFSESEMALTNLSLDGINQIHVVGCGTALLSGAIARYFMEPMLKIPVNVELASEFRYRRPFLTSSCLVIGISQSGETADTLASLTYAKEAGCKVVSICNTAFSSIARMADATLQMKAGPEIGVASTKAFTSQIFCLYLWTLALAKKANRLSQASVKNHLTDIGKLVPLMDFTLGKDEEITQLAKRYYESKNFLYIGRGPFYPLAMEGALKLKEISYIHAEGYAAGELKHGPIALVDKHMPIIAIAPKTFEFYEKTLSNIEEIIAREGRVVAIGNYDDSRLKNLCTDFIGIPAIQDPYLQTILASIPLQLFAYHVAVLLGTDVDQPRNLAKSVTVE